MSKHSEWEVEAREISTGFRLGASLQAGEPMAALIREVAQALGNAPSVLKDDLSRILDELLACHKNNDWLGVADYLEVELVDWLGRFFAETSSQPAGVDQLAAGNSGSLMALGGSGQGGPASEAGGASPSVN